MIQSLFGYIDEGYCEESSRENVRVYSIRTCANKAKYKVTLNNGHIRNVCGTHLRNYYEYDYLNDKPIKGKFIKSVVKVEEIKTNKVIYNKND